MFDVTKNLMEEKTDYSDNFMKTEIFGNEDELLKWVRETGRTYGFVVVILRSDARGNGRKTTLVLGCERSGKYKPYKNELTRNVTENLVGHAHVGRLNADELSLLNDMTKTMVKPRNILLTLKDHNKDNVTTIKQIYNALQAFRTSLRGPRTELQNLMKLMERDNYAYCHRRHEDSNVVRDIVWTHSDAMKLLNIFHIVLIIDTMYKTNKYRLPLLEVVGVTSTELTFSVAFAYMEDIVLMNAVEKVFPVASHLLCQFHIAKNVKAKCKTLVSNTLEWQPIMDVWMSLMHSPTKVDFEMHLDYFEQVCLPFGLFLTYVKHTWLIPHKEKFVDAWINKNMHLGTNTTNRVESAHSRLKNMLQHCLVSRNALVLIDDEKQHINYVAIDSSTCGCTLRKTHGLPCACQLARYVSMGYHIPITEGIDEPWLGLSVQPECDEVIRRFERLDLSGKVALKSKMREVAYPETTSICPPHNKVKTKGGVKGNGKSKYSTKREPLLFEHVDVMHSQQESSSNHPASFVQRLDAKNRNKVTLDKWMTLSDMGYVIASRYNLVLVSLSKSGSMTFSPLRGCPKLSHQIICIRYVYGNHFVKVELKDGSLIPSIALQWRTSRLLDAEAWEFPYYERMAAFNALFTRTENQHVPTIIDLMPTCAMLNASWVSLSPSDPAALSYPHPTSGRGNADSGHDLGDEEMGSYHNRCNRNTNRYHGMDDKDDAVSISYTMAFRLHNQGSFQYAYYSYKYASGVAPRAMLPTEDRSLNNSKYVTLTAVALLSAKLVQPTRCNRYALAAAFKFFYCRALTSNYLASSLPKAGKENNLPVTGRCNKLDTSSRVMDISPTRRWKLDVSLCHLSVNANTRLLSIMECVPSINGPRPE
ncbi:MULE transposase domain [Sesbania bispinosa]|nr:MULE transposase domain [Sesbania bispinosa]